MLLRYQLTYGWRHFRKTEASHAVGRGIDNVIWVEEDHASLLSPRRLRDPGRRPRRLGPRAPGIRAPAVYEALVLTHRLGLRGRRQAP